MTIPTNFGDSDIPRRPYPWRSFVLLAGVAGVPAIIGWLLIIEWIVSTVR